MASTEGFIRNGLTFAGRPASESLKDTGPLARQLIRHVLTTVSPCRTASGEEIRGDITRMAQLCLELSAAVLDGRETPTDRELNYLRAAAAQWAREGVPIGAVNHALHLGFRQALDILVSNSSADDVDNVVAGGKLLISLLDTITSTMTLAYVTEVQATIREQHTAAHTFVTALLGGHGTSAVAREYGFEIAHSYVVLAIDFPRHRAEQDPTLETIVAARRTLRRVRTELAARYTDNACSLLSLDGGTVLIPSAPNHPAPNHPAPNHPAGRGVDGLTDLIKALSVAAEVDVTATYMEAAPRDIPEAADRVHELLNLTRRLRCAPGLYHLDDLALEYQLMRPGPGRQTLGALLSPLDKHPALLETLRTHVGNDLNRHDTARDLHIHPHTVDYRLKRIGQLTGLDPTRPSSYWHLQSALIARTT